MVRSLKICILWAIPSLLLGQFAGQGGTGDGFDRAAAAASPQGLAPYTQLYNGGVGDGYDRTDVANSPNGLAPYAQIYRGGIGDGYDRSEAANSPDGLMPYTQLFNGGTGDGFSGLGVFANPSGLDRFTQIFLGGTGDGYGTESVAEAPPGLDRFAQLFLGGIGDGYVSNFTSSDLGPLPLTLLTFTATPYGKQAHLNWTTEAEYGTEAFIVERSESGATFFQIGSLPAAGNSHSREVLTYELFDPAPLPGTSYYRLRMQDFDGTYSYSELRQVIFPSTGDGSQSVTVFPNPTSGLINVQLWNSNPVSADLTLELLDALGRRALTRRVTTLLGNVQLDLSSLPSGVYLLQVSGLTDGPGSFRINRR